MFLWATHNVLLYFYRVNKYLLVHNVKIFYYNIFWMLCFADIYVPLSTAVETQHYYHTVGFGISAALELAYCRRHNLHPDCRPLSRKRRQANNITWSVQVRPMCSMDQFFTVSFPCHKHYNDRLRNLYYHYHDHEYKLLLLYHFDPINLL